MEELVLLDFFTVRCQPCRMMMPVLEKVQRVKVVKINCDDPENLALAQKHQITHVPTFLLMRGDAVLERRTGLLRLEDLQGMIDSHLDTK